jgi:hypothetical protein
VPGHHLEQLVDQWPLTPIPADAILTVPLEIRLLCLRRVSDPSNFPHIFDANGFGPLTQYMAIGDEPSPWQVEHDRIVNGDRDL